ncbi:hypothetical protein GCM10009564_12530 [Streptomyces thermogriseus]|uniref:Integral membrane protein n=2 Tax=Streptomyces TaxID=1883 RepID=A0ABP4DCN0_9ACTN
MTGAAARSGRGLAQASRRIPRPARLPGGERGTGKVTDLFEEMTSMLLIGLLLLAATAAFTALAIADNLSGGPEYTVSVLGSDIARVNTLEVFSAGLALALLFCLGAALLVGSAARHRRAHRGARGHGGGPGGPMGRDVRR